MEPCQGPSLTGTPATQATCGCASAASPAYEHASAFESAWVMAALPLIWVAVISLVVVRRISRTASTTLGLGPAPELVRSGLPRLVLSKGERRLLLALRRAFARRPARLPATASRACGTT